MDSKTISIIQGETLQTTFTVDAAFTDVSSATFTCKDLGLEIGLIPDNAAAPDEGSGSSSHEPVDPGNSNWYLWYQDTTELRPGVFTYDVTIHNANGTNTLVYEGKLIVTYKTNPKPYNPYYEYPHNTKREH